MNTLPCALCPAYDNKWPFLLPGTTRIIDASISFYLLLETDVMYAHRSDEQHKVFKVALVRAGHMVHVCRPEMSDCSQTARSLF